MSALNRAVSAERVRGRRTATAWLWAFGLAIAVLECSTWSTVATRPLQAWGELLPWQELYATLLVGPLAALVAARTSRRDSEARSGGTPWRSPSPATTRAARLVVLCARQLGFQAAFVLPLLVFGLACGLPGPVPWGEFLGLVPVLWAASLGYSALGGVLAERIGLAGAVGLSMAGQVVGTFAADTTRWWAVPPAWGARAVLAVLHVHANGVPATADDPLLHTSPVLPALLATALGVLLCVAASRLRQPLSGRRRRRLNPARRTAAARGRSGARVVGPELSGAATILPAAHPARAGAGRAARPVVRVRRQPVLAAVTALPTGLLVGLANLAVLLLLATRLVWDPHHVHALLGLAVLPGMAMLTGCLAAQSQTGALRAVHTRIRLRGWALSQAVVLAAIQAPVVVIGAALCGRWAGAMLAVGLTEAAALTAACLWLATRHGVGATCAVMIVGTIISIVFAKSTTGLWLYGPLAWGYSGTTRTRFLLVTGSYLAAAPLAATLWVRATRRAAAHS